MMSYFSIHMSRLILGVLFFPASSNDCCHIFFARLGMRSRIRLRLAILSCLNYFPIMFELLQ
uniref:Light-mediated development protein DET1 n=1 Tax=Arundo donax TaxID=35708 RepID=A0A0A9EX50_ARUDO